MAAQGLLRTAMVPAQMTPAASPSGGADSTSEQGFPVYLHIYDVSREEGIRRLNTVLAHRLSPLKFGGVFHTGVEVDGQEWSFGFSANQSMPGVQPGVPRAHADHTFRQTYQLPCTTRLSAAEIAVVITELREEYPGYDYDLLRRNCCHFADDFCQRLGVGRVPGWVCRLARLGAQVDRALQAAQGRGSWLRQPQALGHGRGSCSRQCGLAAEPLVRSTSRTAAAAG